MRFLIQTTIPFLFFIIGYGFCYWFLGNKTYPSPDLVGLSVHQALLKISPLQINLQLIAQKEHNAIEPGTIISQKPTPNRLIKQHQSILIVTSKKPDKISTPNANNMTKIDLQHWCKTNNISLKTYHIPSTLPDNYYLGQYPNPQENLTDQTLVVYYAQNQNKTFLMPDFCNQKLESVLTTINTYQLPVQILHKNNIIELCDTKNGFVIAQKPIKTTLIDVDKKPIIQLEITFES